MIGNVAITAGGYVGAIAMGFLLLNAIEEVGAEREKCNTRVAVAAQEAAERVSQAKIAAYEAEIARERDRAALERQARMQAEEARAEAESRPAEVREIIREVADANACINTAVPAVVLNRLRD